MAPSQPTIMDIDKAREALRQFTELHQSMTGSTSSAGVGNLGTCLDLYPATGPLLQDAGKHFANYYNPRATAVYNAIGDSINAVGNIVDMLTKTIAAYDEHEKNTKGSADGTGTTPAGKG
jgi:hypothetical protein